MSTTLHPPYKTNALAPGLRVGLFGGSFNPAHEGHLHVSRMAIQALGLDRLWWMVSPQNPLKSTNDMAPFAQRFASAERMARHPHIVVSDIEQKLGTRFTADTLAALKARNPQVQFIWLMGADNLIQFTKWENWQDIARAVPVAVYPRPGYSLQARLSPAAKWYGDNQINALAAKNLADTQAPALVFLDGPEHPASATAIRAQSKS